MDDICVPSSDEEIARAIQLYRSPRIGPAAFRKLARGVESFDEAFERLSETIRSNKISDYQIADLDDAKAELAAGDEFGAALIFEGQANYPKPLLDCPNRPPFLWLKGDLSLFGRLNIAIIGSRNASFDGVRLAQHFARELASEEIVISSGLARGIDAAAHEGALAGGTMGVIAGGLDIHYPQSNKGLQDNIAERGLLISEMPFGHKPQAANFPQRNRIIAALANAVLVVEAGTRSGTKITVDQASALGREIMTIPGSPLNGLSALPNALIREGAVLIRDVIDVREWVASRQSLHAIVKEKGEPERELPANDVSAPPAASSEGNLAQLGKDMIEGRAYQSLDGTIHSRK